MENRFSGTIAGVTLALFVMSAGVLGENNPHMFGDEYVYAVMNLSQYLRAASPYLLASGIGIDIVSGLHAIADAIGEDRSKVE